MFLPLALIPGETNPWVYTLPEEHRKYAAVCEGFTTPGSTILISKAFYKVYPDWRVEYINRPTATPLRTEPRVRSAFSIAPHRSSNSCPYYEPFAPGTKLSTDFRAAWLKPMFNGEAVVVNNAEEREAHIKRIGGEELLRQFKAPNDALCEHGYCLFCFQANYLNYHLKSMERVAVGGAGASGGSGATERATAASYIQFRMPYSNWDDAVSAIARIMKQESFPVKRYAYVRNESEVKGIYQTHSNNMIKKQQVNRYWKGDFVQNRCLNLDDVNEVIGKAGVVQSGDWDAD